MIINMNIIFEIIINLVIILKYVKADCGLPAIPYNAHIDRVQQIYYEGESIEYHCQLEELKIVGSTQRQCINSYWNGTIPRCVEELNYGTIGAIDLSDNMNHTLEYKIKKRASRKKDYTAAYLADPRRESCFRSQKMSRPHTWTIHLNKAQRHISYIEMVFLDKNNKLSSTDARKIIKSIKVNEFRDCDPTILQITDSTKRLGMNCFVEFDGDQYETWEKDQTLSFSIEFDANDIQICEIRLYKNSFMPYHRCGSADIVLHSTLEFVKSGTKHNGASYYRYTCDKGFKLIGSETVRCGLNNNWLDPFPTCKPEVTCPYPPTKDQDISVNINYEHLYSFNGNISAIVGSVVSFECVGDHNNKSIMIGDSVRVCGSDGNWTGVDPQCIHDYELNADYFKDIQNLKQNDKQMTTFETFDKFVDMSNKTAFACGIPALPLFAKPTTGPKFRLFGGQSDIRPWYENGSIINYQCESAYRWVTGDVSKRTCINGKWNGKVGKCAVNWGNKVSLSSIFVYDLSKNKWIDSQTIFESNSSNPMFDQHFAYRRDADKDGECAKYTVDTIHKWVLRLNKTVGITYFTVMLHPGGFFGNKHKIDDPKILETSAVTALVGQSDCVLTSAWDYTHSKVGTYFFFTCDLSDRKSAQSYWNNDITLIIDPKKFDRSYTSKNISLCSLAVLLSKEDCGSPDIPLHSTVSVNYNTKEWTYSCEEGYALVGSPTVACGKNGRWSGEFPTCQKKEMCPISDVNSQVVSRVLINYKNLMTTSVGKQSATVDSLSNYTCIKGKFKRVLIGPQIRVCTKSGEWSGSQPYCMNPNKLPQKKKEERSHSSGFKVFGIVFAVLVSIGFIGLVVWYALNKGYLSGVSSLRMPKIDVPKINIHRPSSGTGSSNGTAKDINSNDKRFENKTIESVPELNPSPQQRQKTSRINETLPVFSTGTELLIEPDFDV